VFFGAAVSLFGRTFGIFQKNATTRTFFEMAE
jgi:hypothetical protein